MVDSGPVPMHRGAPPGGRGRLLGILLAALSAPLLFTSLNPIDAGA
ncbi:MAG: hypothetical protein ACE5GW_02360 [Planctomycetota bacterium]